MESSKSSIATCNSPVVLFHQLLKCIDKAQHKQRPLESVTGDDRSRKHIHLQRKLYETLFNHLDGPLHNKRPSSSSGPEARKKIRTKEHLLQTVFTLRRLRKFDRGHRLEALVEKLPDLEDGMKWIINVVINVLFE